MSITTVIDHHRQSLLILEDNMKRGRIRFFGQIALAILAGTSFLLTLVWRDWIEAVLRFGPDEHDGSLELVVSSLLLTATVALIASVRAEWRRRTLVTVARCSRG